MELGKQIKKYRMKLNLSQEQLADKVYVSRQSISNWENDKNYPDINSLLRLSELFNTSLDSLIKGDIEKMKLAINNQDKKEFDRVGTIFTILLLVMILSPIPLVYYGKITGIVIWILLFIVTMYYSLQVEKYKKKHDIQTYKEIIAFNKGETLDEISKIKEQAKRPYQKVLLGILSGIITLLISIIMLMLIK